ncbi:MAG: 4-amino-4-deoxy-L-arabinose-phosphoundecaprenol flippase subunit ArnE [Rhodothermaeota bacterium MED-G12]|jgi:multidrug transporter EmrE-like cation transporter|nr:hypothetical protein [Bacteroidia bacterium]CAI8409172.1 MAG: 4-amino-4-deoxy-L-arabinose-phosphoundecaprenol flippase subunit ArnE [Rhodothermaeota bacterium MED-G12]|tara:strand:- start:15109 stop:15456 length:348 start_codon:yes stop_codon:yes gene_type:complete
MNTSIVSVIYFIIAAMFGALGQYLYKAGAESSSGTLFSYLTNLKLIGGVLCYITVMILFVAAFKKGGSLTVLYPIYATTFIWAALIALLAYGTPIKIINLVGMLLMIGGMYLMGK